MAPRTKAVGAAAPADAVTEVVDSTLVDGVGAAADPELAAVAETAVQDGPVEVFAQVDEAQIEAFAPVTPVWPKLVTLRNNSAMQLVEPITGKFLFAFSSEVAELHSQEQADSVIDNLRALASVNGLGDLLTIDGLPV